MRGQNDQPAPGERIAKVIARAGLASRREAEAWIAAGRVAINGAVIASPALNVTAGDRVTVDGKPLPARERTRLFLYHKPRGLVTTHADPGGRPTIFAALPKHLPRLISVGRLDLNTEGLLLLTNDGGLARVLELPETGWLRRYRVRAHGRVHAGSSSTRCATASRIDGIRYGPIEARLDREQGTNVWLTFAIREGKNREVRNVLEHLGLAVSRLIRVSFGPFQLGELRRGRGRGGEDPASARAAGRAGDAARRERISPAPMAERDIRAGHSNLHGRGRLWIPVRAPRRATGMTSERRLVGPRDAGERTRSSPAQSKHRKSRRSDAERVGAPELARREQGRGRKPYRGKKR